MPKESVPHLVNKSYNQVAIVTDYSCHVSFSPGSDFSPISGFLLVRDTRCLILLRSGRRTYMGQQFPLHLSNLLSFPANLNECHASTELHLHVWQFEKNKTLILEVFLKHTFSINDRNSLSKTFLQQCFFTVVDGKKIINAKLSDLFLKPCYSPTPL